MATETIPGPFGEVRAASTAGGGTALTATAARIMLPPGTKHIDLVPRNMAGAAVVQWLPCPWLTIFKTTDSLATEPTNYSYQAQDNSTTLSGVVLSSIGTAAQGDYLYVGAPVQFNGVAVDVDAANSNASVLTVNYWADGSWEDTSASDGTDSGGVSMAVDGEVTWSVASGGWTTTTLLASGDTTAHFGLATQDLFWTRWQWSAALDASTTADSMIAIPRSTVYSEIPAGLMFSEAVTVGPTKEGISAIQAKTDAGTANLIVDCAARGRFYA